MNKIIKNLLSIMFIILCILVTVYFFEQGEEKQIDQLERLNLNYDKYQLKGNK